MINQNNMTYYGERSPLIQRICPAPKRYFQQLIKNKGFHTGLDIGSGGGSLLSDLRNSTFSSTGIDIDENCIKEASSNNIHDEYILGDFMTHEFKKI